jgi:hypothetical protein
VDHDIFRFRRISLQRNSHIPDPFPELCDCPGGIEECGMNRKGVFYFPTAVKPERYAKWQLMFCAITIDKKTNEYKSFTEQICPYGRFK